MKKLVLFAALMAILIAYGCNEENVYMPDMNTDGRIIGTIQGVVTDGADATLLPGVEVSTTVRGDHVTTITDATGHYSFTDLDPGTYVLTYIFPEAQEDKEVKNAYAGVIGEAYIPTLDEVSAENYPGIDSYPTDEDFPYEVDANVNLYPLNGGAEGYVWIEEAYQTFVPAGGATVVADFGGYSYKVGSFEVALIDHEWFATTNSEGWYSFSGLPTGLDGMLNLLPYNDDGTYYDEQNMGLYIENGGHFLADTFILGEALEPTIIAQNWNEDIPFAASGSFVATFRDRKSVV